ncbi:spermatogenesis associated 2-like [Poecilia reticulata]|uniref:Spermatogenesis associated 2 like n=1 Tax=Poecilia reticulata TaxID=8081 RepID=A0A3P9QAB8_POERE|nr:PREDICTED: spermatogenesis-associated protein 2-like protein [Poecilia reticulata]XP_008410939.1 PREDICTED: spermatogenesis-associated protein 2-like protein [Poecilia reticulata]XP_017160732.1 PREDICTED: spermatogenesis-associated protein 2-like protein [Poecilia reticulata]
MRGVDLVQAYDRVLEQQILGRGSCRACQDEALRSEVEGLLATSDPRELHGLGLEPLRLMEEVLEARPGSGLRGLARTFEVLEQAALNLYLGPWREEYRVIKMYSGTFTHCVAPVLSAPQTEEVFGLLGYRPGPAQTRLLRLQPSGGPVAPRELLRLACAFFLARCECRLLLAALGKRGGARRELGVVRERRRGQRLQVAVDNAERLLSVPQDAEGQLDLYREDSTAPPGGQRRSNGPVAAPRSRLGPVVSPPLEADRGRPHDLCGCLSAPPLGLQRCLDCGVLHDVTCVRLTDCRLQRHQVEPASGVPETGPETGEERPRDAVPEDTAALQPISYHCEAASANPHLLCLTCRAVHGSACVEGRLCRSAHRTRRLGTCSCGKSCCGTPRVLCLYCGDEFCRDCWYKNPLTCVCGRSFHLSTDLSSSV